jgi:polysaccharide pyruvyl transferase WcaK-like protein
MAMVDFYRFPVVIRPWGPKKDRYSWPVYFAHGPEQRRKSEALTSGYAELADRVIEEHRRHVAFMCMEELDEAIAHRVQASLRRPDRTRIFSAREHNASQMTSLVRSLDVLITARYHGSVLALGGLHPQIAFGHDLRLKNLYEELGLYPQYFVDAHAEDRFELLNDHVERLLARPEVQSETLRRGYLDQLARVRINRELLARFVAEHGWGTTAWAA